MALIGCGGSTVHKTSTTSTAQKTPAPQVNGIPTAQDRNPNQQDYWAPQYENGLVSSCVNNKITPTKGICTCIVALLQSHHPALGDQAGARAVIQQWMRTASGNPYGLRDYAQSCSNR